MPRDNSSAESETRESAYRFALWICDVADCVVRRLKEEEPRTFIYRGADLERAFKRAVYFLFVNDPLAHSAFLSEQRGVKPTTDVGTPVGEVLAAYYRPPLATRRAGSFTDALKGAVARVATAARLGSRRRPAGFTRGLWALAIQPKFVDHMAPIVKNMRVPCYFVTFDDPATELYLQGSGAGYLNAGAGKETATHGRRFTTLGLVHSHALAFDAVRRRIDEERPIGIVLSEGNAPIYDIVNEAARQFEVPVVCVQQGWSPIVHTGFRDLRFSSMIVWGEWFVSALSPHSPEQRFEALGHHLIGLAPPKDGRPRVVGFFLQHGTRLISDEAWEGMLSLIEFCANELPDVRVLVREHPNAPLTREECERVGALPAVSFLPPREVALHSALKECDVVVSVYSTTILEGIGVGALPLVVNVTSMPSYYPDVAAEGAGIEVKNFLAAREALRALWSEGTSKYGPGLSHLQRRLFAHGGEEARARIVEHLRASFRL